MAAVFICAVYDSSNICFWLRYQSVMCRVVKVIDTGVHMPFASSRTCDIEKLLRQKRGLYILHILTEIRQVAS